MSGFFAGQGLVINGITHLSPREALAAVGRGAALVDLRLDLEVANLNGGIHDWDGDGLPLKMGDVWGGPCACRLRPRPRT
jgi:hypothetical protein